MCPFTGENCIKRKSLAYAIISAKHRYFSWRFVLESCRFFWESCRREAVQNFTFESLEQFCNDKACFDGMHGMEVEYGACYGGTVCRGKLHWVGTVRIAGEG